MEGDTPTPAAPELPPTARQLRELDERTRRENDELKADVATLREQLAAKRKAKRKPKSKEEEVDDDDEEEKDEEDEEEEDPEWE